MDRPAVKIARTVVGLAVGAVFAWATITRADVGAVAESLGRAALPGVIAGLIFAWLEVCVRAWRWQFLLSPLGRIGYRTSLAYTCIGYFANLMLPMRLGDVARGYLAATALRLPRLATLGSIVAERLADGLTVLALAFVLGLTVTGAWQIASTAIWIGLIILLVGAAAAAAMAAINHERLAHTRLSRAIREPISRLAAGADAIRTPTGFLVVLAATLTSYVCAVAALAAVAASVGLSLSPQQAALVMAWLALSTAIPAAPGSVGTYEFVGVFVLVTVLGQDRNAALAAVVLLHVIGALPSALVGLVMTWVLHVRVWRLEGTTAPATAAPAAAPAD
jgi:uncharacterized protein (TIRG00374 family)